MNRVRSTFYKVANFITGGIDSNCANAQNSLENLKNQKKKTAVKSLKSIKKAQKVYFNTPPLFFKIRQSLLKPVPAAL